jgi:hypothetical protein
MPKTAASLWTACIKALDHLVKTPTGAPVWPAAFVRANTALKGLDDLPYCTPKEWKVIVQKIKVSCTSNHKLVDGQLQLFELEKLPHDLHVRLS